MILVWVLASILVVFILFTLIKSSIHKRFGIRICSICAAVTLTWVALLILRATGNDIDLLMIGILLGESITGIMYLFEKAAVKRDKHILWLKAVIIILGTGLVYSLLSQGMSTISILLLIVTAAFAVAVYILLQKKSKHVPLMAHGKFRNEMKKLEEAFEHCCD
jgi:NO-binding membrane sensor protein with MHYT domain